MSTMSTMSEYPGVDQLYVDTIDVTATPRDWSEGFTESWDYMQAPTCPECGEYGRWIAESDLPEVTLVDVAGERDDPESWEAWRCPNAECERFGREVAPEDGGPMMSYSYALPAGDSFDQSHADRIRHLPLCIIDNMDGSYELALTGGGMNLSWRIAEAFMQLGYLPPLAFCDPPRMAGMEMDERHRWIVAGCLRSCDVACAQAERLAEDLRRL
jgi:hypothetical protein